MRRAVVSLSLIALYGLAGPGAAAVSGAPSQRPPVVRDGPVRVQVLSPTLFRLEYAADGGFEDRPTLTASQRPPARGRVKSRVVDGVRIISTRRAILSYRLGAGPFEPANLSLRLRGHGGAKGQIHPAFAGPNVPPATTAPPGPPAPNPDPDPSPSTAGNLGGWYRALDNQAGPVALHDGLLSRDGWYLLDDTTSPVLTDGGRWYAARAAHEGAYQDGYLFAYGHDYRAALADFRRLAGAPPLLPRKAFGVWFSRYAFYAARAYQRLVASFRAQRVPLDVLVLDTDFRSPNPWNGWSWTQRFFPKPEGFLKWAHSKGLDLIANVHPSITEADPRFAAADALAGGLPVDSGRCKAYADTVGPCRVWDWARPEHVQSYFSLHQPFEREGMDSWWLDWNRDESRVSAAGLTPDAWINSLYAGRQDDRGNRWLPLSRIGSSMWHFTRAMPGVWAEHRNAIHFTGDAASTWEMLDFQSRFTAAEGAGIGMPYVSHDIGGFTVPKLADDLYVRWIQFGVFQPILRLHSDHGRRLPWEYGKRADRVASEFLRLRESLVPYTYTAARQAHDSGMPIVRAMYLGWPGAGAAYRFDRQYMFGESLLVAPVAAPGKRAAKRVWFPPGEWIDVFTGQTHRGPRAKTLSVPLERMPVFARAGAILPRHPYTSSVEGARADRLLIDVYAGDDGAFSLYEDAGDDLAYRKRAFSRTGLRWRERGVGSTLTVGRARGAYTPAAARDLDVKITGVKRPRRVLLSSGGPPRPLRGWSYDPRLRQLVVRAGRLSTARDSVISLVSSTSPPRRRGGGGRPGPNR
jgi:hypothetical protein